MPFFISMSEDDQVILSAAVVFPFSNWTENAVSVTSSPASAHIAGQVNGTVLLFAADTGAAAAVIGSRVAIIINATITADAVRSPDLRIFMWIFPFFLNLSGYIIHVVRAFVKPGGGL